MDKLSFLVVATIVTRVMAANGQVNERTMTIAEGFAETCSEALSPLGDGNFTILQEILNELGNEVITKPGEASVVDILIFPNDYAFNSLSDKLGVSFEQVLADRELLKSMVLMHIMHASSIDVAEAVTQANVVVTFSNGTMVRVKDFPDLALSPNATDLVVKGPVNEVPIYALVDCNAPTRANRMFVLYANEVLLPESAVEGASPAVEALLP